MDRPRGTSNQPPEDTVANADEDQRAVADVSASATLEASMVDEIVRGVREADELRAERISLGRQVLNETLLEIRPEAGRHSLDSRIPAQRNLQFELERAAREQRCANGI